MFLNSIKLVDRHNRPSVTSKVALRVLFINQGEAYDPYSISGVTIFNRLANLTPSGIINQSTNLISSSVASGTPLMHFGTSAAASSYVAATTASSIYKIGTGDYVVVLDGTLALSGFYSLNGSGYVLGNAVSAVADYLDVWTVKLSQNSDYTTLINEFSLHDDVFITLTEPLLWTVTNRLVNKYIPLDSKVKLLITTDLTIGNKSIDQSVKNLLRETVITDPKFLIEKINEHGTALPARVEVSGFSDTSSTIEVTSENTMTLLFNTEALKTHAQTLAGNLGSIRGVYSVTAKFTLIDQIIKTKPLFFIIE